MKEIPAHTGSACGGEGKAYDDLESPTVCHHSLSEKGRGNAVTLNKNPKSLGHRVLTLTVMLRAGR